MRIKYQTILHGIIVVLIAVGGMYTYHLSQHWERVLISHIQKKLYLYQKTTGIKHEWEQISVSFIFPKIKIKKLTAHMPNYPAISKPILAKQLVITPDYIPILVKKKLSAKVLVIQPIIKINISGSSRFHQKNLLFAIGDQKAPTINIILKNISLSLNTGKETLLTEALDLHIQSHSSHIAMHAEASAVQLGDRPPFYLRADMIWKPYSFFIKNFFFHNTHSSLKASGQVDGILRKKKN